MTALRTILFLLLASLASARPVVVSTNTILDDFVRTLGGEQIDARCLLAPGVDPHSYAPTPADIRQIAHAQLVVVNGLGFETWIDKLIENSGYRGPRVVATTGVTPLRIASHADHDHAAHDHDHGEIDPHAWHDLRNVHRYIENIRDALARLEPAHAETFRARATAYLAAIDALDSSARLQLAALPAARRKLVTSHDALRYLGRAYDLTIVPIAGLSPDQEPSAKQLAAIVKLIRQQNVRAIFIEATSNPKIPALLAREAGVAVVSELYTDSLGSPGTPGATFLGLFRANLDTLARSLR